MRFLNHSTGVAAICCAALFSYVAIGKAPFSVQAKKAWISTPVSGQTVAAGYVSLHNTGHAPDTLVSAWSPSARSVQLHKAELVNGIARMRRVDGMRIAPRSNLDLAPGGNHLMLVGLKRPLQQGQKVSIRLQFASGARVLVDFPVKSIDQHSKHNGEEHAHH